MAPAQDWGMKFYPCSFLTICTKISLAQNSHFWMKRPLLVMLSTRTDSQVGIAIRPSWLITKIPRTLQMVWLLLDLNILSWPQNCIKGSEPYQMVIIPGSSFPDMRRTGSEILNLFPFSDAAADLQKSLPHASLGCIRLALVLLGHFFH